MLTPLSHPAMNYIWHLRPEKKPRVQFMLEMLGQVVLQALTERSICGTLTTTVGSTRNGTTGGKGKQKTEG